MPKELNVHIGSIALHLSLMKDSTGAPNATEKEYIGEITSASAAFALNSIPSMTITVPHGVRIDKKDLKDAYVYEAKLQEAIDERKLVGVYLDWLSDEDVWGMPPKNTCVCLFKGYILAQSVQNSMSGGTTQFTIVHWLTDLTNVAIINRLSSPDNPADISADSVFTQFDPTSKEGVESVWVPGNAYTKALNTKGYTLFDAIKAGLLAAMEEGQNVAYEQAGSLRDEKYYIKSKEALNALSQMSLDFSSDIQLTSRLKEAISATLSQDTRANYLSTTLWQKLLQVFLPQYYMALVPCVNSAYIIPQPGIQITEENSFKINDESIVSLNTRTQHGKTLGAVFLAARNPLNESALLPVRSYATKFQYPDDRKEAGIMKACNLPAWLEQYSMMATTLGDTCAEWADFAKPETNLSMLYDEEDEAACAKLCKLFVKTVYHAEVTRGNTATLVTPLCLTLVPGLPIKVHVPKDVLSHTEDKYICGVIEKVQYTISTTSMSTTFDLSDLRVGTQVDKFTLDNALLYKKAFDYKDTEYIKLYEDNGKALNGTDKRIEEAKCKRNL